MSLRWRGALVLSSLLVVGAFRNERDANAGEAPDGRTPPPPPPSVVANAPPWMGVTMDNGSELGVKVEHVVRSSPAERAGVRAGDRIVAVDGSKITMAAHVSKSVGARRVGDTVKLSLERTGSAMSASVVLAARPSGDEILRMDLVGAPAPAWTNVRPLSGAPSSLASLKGKVVLLDFWAEWCGPCRLLSPKLSALKDRFGAQGLSVVGVTTNYAKRAAVFSEKHQMKFPCVVDKDADTSRAYGITGLPTMVLVDKKGVVREVFVGYDPAYDTRLESLIKTLLAEQATAAASPGAASSGSPAPAPSPSAPAPSPSPAPVPTPSVPRPER